MSSVAASTRTNANRKGPVTDVSGPQRNACPGTLTTADDRCRRTRFRFGALFVTKWPYSVRGSLCDLELNPSPPRSHCAMEQTWALTQKSQALSSPFKSGFHSAIAGNQPTVGTRSALVEILGEGRLLSASGSWKQALTPHLSHSFHSPSSINGVS